MKNLRLTMNDMLKEQEKINTSKINEYTNLKQTIDEQYNINVVLREENTNLSTKYSLAQNENAKYKNNNHIDKAKMMETVEILHNNLSKCKEENKIITDKHKQL
jgi:hypothetical protein